ncbi:MAG: aminotransferase class V-fold PLP-dependent enzyme [Deltaproteobacteria bacterium]|nr:aminotransferase class V-fold PLP-dependent enzyme [Deltaproteobacteria bacterium]
MRGDGRRLGWDAARWEPWRRCCSFLGGDKPARRHVKVTVVNPWQQAWLLDPKVTFLNHGSYGACPRDVLAEQERLRHEIERQPVHFFARMLEGLLEEARAELALFVGASADDLAFVPNATAGVNAVVRSLCFEAGDELLVTNHAYNACKNAFEGSAERQGARVVVAEVPFPLHDPGQVVSAVEKHVTGRTRLALIDHVTSPTGLVFPIERLVAMLSERGVDVLVDGAHAPGMLPLDLAALSALGAAYYTGNCHKWMCSPKGAGFLHVRRDRQHLIRPTSISHGANSPRRDRSRFRLEFDWTGTMDPTPYLCVPHAIRLFRHLLPGGWTELMARNRGLALVARQVLCDGLGMASPSPAEMVGSLAAVPLPPGDAETLQRALLERHGIEVPVIPWPETPGRLVRVSAQLYNEPWHYEKLVNALRECL